MIVMYPMLVSTTLSTDTLPAITKVLEKFILLYRMDEFIERFKRADFLKAAAQTAAKLIGQKDYKDQISNILAEQESEENIYGGTKKLPKEREREKRPYDPLENFKVQNVDIRSPSRESLSLEPTWLKIQHPKWGDTVVGVKALPFPVSSEYNLMYYLTQDMTANMLTSYVKGKIRTWGRSFWSIIRGAHIPIVSKLLTKTLTGDPLKDILYGETLFRHNIFCMVNYNDTVTSGLLKDPKILRKMYGMGWNSLIFSDDINRKSIFCMKEFEGLCSTIPYQIMGASFGSDYSKVFQSMEEVRKASASFFSLKSPKGLFVEGFTNIDNYLKKLFEEKDGRSK